MAASFVALIAAAALGFLLLAGLMVVWMPKSDWAGALVGGLLIVVFGFTFAVCFREMLDKLTPQ
jgi:hypothetical protein